MDSVSLYLVCSPNPESGHHCETYPLSLSQGLRVARFAAHLPIYSTAWLSRQTTVPITHATPASTLLAAYLQTQPIRSILVPSPGSTINGTALLPSAGTRSTGILENLSLCEINNPAC